MFHLLGDIDPTAYTAKVRLLHLPERFGRNLHIKLVDGQLPGNCFIYPRSSISQRTPKVRLLHLPKRFGRKLHIKLVDGQLPGRCVSTRRSVIMPIKTQNNKKIQRAK